jgi:hypothetical protein
LPFYQFAIYQPTLSPTCDFTSLPFINLPFTKWQFHQLAMSIYLNITLPLHQPAIYKRAFLQLAIFQLYISPACHFINLLFYKIASLTTFKFGILLFGQIGILSNLKIYCQWR